MQHCQQQLQRCQQLIQTTVALQVCTAMKYCDVSLTHVYRLCRTEQLLRLRGFCVCLQGHSCSLMVWPFLQLGGEVQLASLFIGHLTVHQAILSQAHDHDVLDRAAACCEPVVN